MRKFIFMKIFGSKSLSSILYYLTRLGLWVSISFLLFVVISLTVGFISYWLDWENALIALSMKDEFSLHIKPLGIFFIGEMGLPAIIPMFIFTTASFYVLALYFLNRLFKNFTSSVIFQKEVIKSLNGLAISFLAAAILSFCMMYFSPHSDSDFLAALLLIFFALILFFIKEVFRQGVVIQEEQNLTI